MIDKQKKLAGMIIALAGWIVLYASTTFITMSPGPSNWTPGGRFVFVFIGLVWVAVVATAVVDDD